MAFSVVVIAFALEMAAALVYCFAVGFYKLASDNNNLPSLFKAFFMLVVNIFLLVDAACLFCSVVVSDNEMNLYNKFLDCKSPYTSFSLVNRYRKFLPVPLA